MRERGESAIPDQKQYRSRLVLLAFLVVLAGLGGFADRWYGGKLLRTERIEYSSDLSHAADEISKELNKRLVLLGALKSFIEAELKTYPEMGFASAEEQEEFNAFVPGLRAGTKFIRFFAIAPDGVIEKIFPKQGHEGDVGRFIEFYPEQSIPQPGSGAAIDLLWSTFPAEREGATVTVSRPVYNKGVFWGGAVMSLGISDLLGETFAKEKSPKMKWAVRGLSSRPFFGDGVLFQTDSVRETINLPNAVWELAGIPVAGWGTSTRSERNRFRLGMLALSFLLVVVGIFVLNREKSLLVLNKKLRRVVSERHQAENTLRAQYGFLQTLIDAIPVPVFYQDTEGVYLGCNIAFVEFLELPKREIIGKRAEEILSMDLKGLHSKADGELLHDGRGLRHEVTLNVPGHGRRDVIVHNAAFLRDDGSIGGLIGAVFDMSERKRAEEVSLRLGRIVEESLNEVYIFDSQSLKFTQVNHGARKNLGYGMNELKGMTPLDLVPDFTPETFAHILDPLREGRLKQVSFETAHLRKDGSTYAVSIRLQLMSTETPPVFVAIVGDITERKKAEATVKVLARFPEESPGPMLRFDTSGVILYANKASAPLLQFWGCETGDMLPDEWRKRIGDALETGEAREIDINRGSRTYSLVLVPFPEAGYVNAYASDISVRLAAETALKESGERFRDIASAASDWFWETDENMRFVFLSDRAYDLLDIERDSVLGKMNLDVSAVEKMPGESERRRKYSLDLEAHRPFRDFSYSITDHDGNRRHLKISGVPIFEDDGTFCGYRGTGTDVTGLVAAEEALRASEERHRIFAADVAHELRTPLAIFRSNLDSLEDSDASVSLREEVDSMSRIVEQLLISARMDTLEIDENDVADLKDICTKVATYIAPLAVMEYKSLEVLAPEGPVLIRGHEGALEQALRNLIENAIRYSARKTTITIEVDMEPSIRVIDHGRGVPLQKREEIFRRFLRSDRRSGGAGIGLSIVRRVVDAHGGGIQVKDTPGGGATFEIVFSPELLLGAEPEQDMVL